MVEKDTKLDLLVIGAGISGLAMARFYLETHPNCQLAVLERDGGVGGSWSTARLYDHFWSQIGEGYAQFSDLPMEKPVPEDMLHGFFKSKHSAAYLEKYACHHSFAGKSLQDRIRFNTEVKSLERRSDRSWLIRAQTRLRNSDAVDYVTLEATNVAVASGLTSVPYMPVIPGAESFSGPMVHTLDFGQSQVLSSRQYQKVSVIGAGKSAADMVYAAVKAGKNVSWIIRPGGVGPAFFAPVETPGPFRGAFDLGSTRAVEHLGPSLVTSDGLFKRQIHGTNRGASVIAGLFGKFEEVMSQIANYNGRPCKKSFDKLQPLTGIFWNNGPGGLLNHHDFFETVAQHVDVYQDNIETISANKIHLVGGEVIQCDALLCGTGWRKSFSFMSDELRAQLGLPCNPVARSTESTKHWTQLEQAADREVVEKFPLLANPPEHYHRYPPDGPFRLHNQIVPIGEHDQSIAFIGQVVVSNYYRVTEVQSMWATAYFDKQLQLPSVTVQENQTAQFVAWNRRRYLSTGEDGNLFPFETIAYTDKLLAELGLRSHRKNFLRNLFYPTTPADLTDLLAEYIAKYGKHGKVDV